MAKELSKLGQKLSGFMPLTNSEYDCLAELQSAPIQVKRGRELVHEGQARQIAYIMQTGWGVSYKLLPDGGRQIIAFPIPGDFIGLRSVLLRTSDHSFSALTDATVTGMDAGHMMETFNDFPRLGVAVLWAVSRDEAMVVEHLVNIGRRDSLQRTAHFFVELHERLHLVGLVFGGQFDCPLTQNALADALGLSAIHVNRVLRKLRERKLMTLMARKATILDLEGLRLLAGLEPVAVERQAPLREPRKGKS
jgi:CRP-like cAMP-binding protein